MFGNEIDSTVRYLKKKKKNTSSKQIYKNYEFSYKAKQKNKIAFTKFTMLSNTEI